MAMARESNLTRKRKIRISKTRVRSHLRRIAQYFVADIDRFRELVADARRDRRKAVDGRAAGLPAEAQDFLADELYELDTASALADQLSIVALYGVVELTTGRILAHAFGPSAAEKASKIDAVKKLLKTKKNLDLCLVPQYRAIDELRLLNNAVKHEGRVSRQLATEYHRWTEGDPLTGLDAAYDRLCPKVPAYIFNLATRMKLRNR